jgi:hypothetical protein
VTVWSYAECWKCEEIQDIFDQHQLWAHFPEVDMFDGDGRYMEEELVKVTERKEIP